MDNTTTEFKFTASYTRADAMKSLRMYRDDLARWEKVVRSEKRAKRTSSIRYELAVQAVAECTAKIELCEYRIKFAQYA